MQSFTKDGDCESARVRGSSVEESQPCTGDVGRALQSSDVHAGARDARGQGVW